MKHLISVSTKPAPGQEDDEEDLLGTLKISSALRERVEAVLATQMARACTLIEDARADVMAVAEALVTRRRLGIGDLRDVIGSLS